ncbi:MAG TPA: hypothetical protein VFI47_02930, partial [Acidimicrobiales bacterium]|nr:hypothetical protein [Acidimicrobiales bacterium]
MDLAKVLGAIGRSCITAGVLILLFVSYQLWGTGIREAQAQSSLENEFEKRLDDAGLGDAAGGTAGGPGTTAAGTAPSQAGAAPPPAPPAD